MRAIYLDEPLVDQQRNDIDQLGYHWPENRTRWPALRSGVDAVHSKIAQSHPRPVFLTTDGDFELQNRAEMATAWMDGEFSRVNMDELLERVFLDAEIYGTGVMWVGERHDQPHYERTWVGDLYVDPREERNDCVRSLYRVRRIDVGVLAERFPDSKDEIEKAKRAPALEGDELMGSDLGIADVVEVYEAWRLPDGPDAKGRHTIVVDGATLLDDRKWAEDRFPFAMVHWSRDPKRFFGIGLVEQMLAPQAELNEMAERNSDARRLLVPIILAEEESIQHDAITNATGSIVYYQNKGSGPPQVSYPSAMFMAMAQSEELYIERVWKLAGISTMSAASQLDAKLSSGKAIQNFANLESERFAMANRSWERLAIEVARLSYRTAQRISTSDASEERKLEVLGGADGLEAITFSEANMGNEAYKIDVFPVSALSKSISAKIDEVMSLVNAQLVDDPEDAREMIDIPDLKRNKNVVTAGRKYVRKIVDKALKHGIATSPDPYMPLPYLIRYGGLSVNIASEKEAPEEHIQVLRDMVQAAVEMKAATSPPPPSPPMPGPAMGPAPMPPGGPMPPMPPELAVVPPMG